MKKNIKKARPISRKGLMTLNSRLVENQNISYFVPSFLMYTLANESQKSQRKSPKNLFFNQKFSCKGFTTKLLEKVTFLETFC